MEKGFIFKEEIRRMYGEEVANNILESLKGLGLDQYSDTEKSFFEKAKENDLKIIRESLESLKAHPEIVEKLLIDFGNSVLEKVNKYGGIGFETKFMKVYDGKVFIHRDSKYENIGEELYDICNSICITDSSGMQPFISFKYGLIYHAGRINFIEKIDKVLPGNDADSKGIDKDFVSCIKEFNYTDTLIGVNHLETLRNLLIKFGMGIAEKLKSNEATRMSDFYSDLIVIEDGGVGISNNLYNFDAETLVKSICEIGNMLRRLGPTFTILFDQFKKDVYREAKKIKKSRLWNEKFIPKNEDAKLVDKHIEFLSDRPHLIKECLIKMGESLVKKMKIYMPDARGCRFKFMELELKTDSVSIADDFMQYKEIGSLFYSVCRSLCNAGVPDAMEPLNILKSTLAEKVSIERKMKLLNEATKKEDIEEADKYISFLCSAPDVLKRLLLEFGAEYAEKAGIGGADITIDDDFLSYRDKLGTILFEACEDLFETGHDVENFFYQFKSKLKAEVVKIEQKNMEDLIKGLSGSGQPAYEPPVDFLEVYSNIKRNWVENLLFVRDDSPYKTKKFDLGFEADAIFHKIIKISQCNVLALDSAAENNIYAAVAYDYLENHFGEDCLENLEYISSDQSTKDPDTIMGILKDDKFAEFIILTSNIETILSKALEDLSTNTERIKAAMAGIGDAAK